VQGERDADASPCLMGRFNLIERRVCCGLVFHKKKEKRVQIAFASLYAAGPCVVLFVVSLYHCRQPQIIANLPPSSLPLIIGSLSTSGSGPSSVRIVRLSLSWVPELFRVEP
jgi:hypothetical protein